ncbi:MAG: peroxide stress protein YaaA, partial [Flavobacteriales bacterium]
MIILLSPAKDLAAEVPNGIKGTTQPALLEHSPALIAKLRILSAKRIAKLMDISPKLAELNHERYQRWNVPFTTKNARPAVFTFNGEAYRGLNARTLDSDDLRFAQHHLRILSGLYGLLRPLDLIQDYRLEMGTSLAVG